MPALVLDPMLFNGITEQRVTALLAMLRFPGCFVPEVQWYWDPLYAEYIRPQYARLPREAKLGLDEIRFHTRPIELPDLPARIANSGVHELFGGLPGDWPLTMRRLTTGCLLIEVPSFVVTVGIVGRNIHLWTTGHSTLREKRPWRVTAQPEGGPLHAGLVALSRRNLEINWTCRFASLLPEKDERGVEFPFCPPDGWEDPSCDAFTTHASRSAWRDKKRSHWAAPNTPGEPEHWDVYLEAGLGESYGLNQLNIGRAGTPLAGKIHHIPTAKRPHLKKETGWRC